MKHTPPPHSCRDMGHIWTEPDGTLYTRHRNRRGTVALTCLYCEASANLPAHGKATMPFVEEVVKATAALPRDQRTKLDAKRTAHIAHTVSHTSAKAKIGDSDQAQ